MHIVKKTVRHVGKRVLRPILKAQRASTGALLDSQWERFPAALDAAWERLPGAPWQRQRVDKGTQTLLHLAYQDLLRSGKPLPRLDEVGFRAFSQFDEDGILLYLFSVLGVANKSVVEICAGVGYECNAANLIINHAWDGLLFDGDEATSISPRGSTLDVPTRSGARPRFATPGSTPRPSTTASPRTATPARSTCSRSIWTVWISGSGRRSRASTRASSSSRSTTAFPPTFRSPSRTTGILWLPPRRSPAGWEHRWPRG